MFPLRGLAPVEGSEATHLRRHANLRNRTLLSAAVGGAAAYLLDPELGEGRRQRVLDLWEKNGAARREVGRAASRAARTAGPMVEQLGQKNVGLSLTGKEVGV